MELTKDEYQIILNLLAQISLPVEQTEKILLSILEKLRAKLIEPKVEKK